MYAMYLETGVGVEECVRRIRQAAAGAAPGARGEPRCEGTTTAGLTRIDLTWRGGARLAAALKAQGSRTWLALRFRHGPVMRYVVPAGQAMTLGAFVFAAWMLSRLSPIVAGVSNFALFVLIGLALAFADGLLLWLVFRLGTKSFFRKLARAVEGETCPASLGLDLESLLGRAPGGPDAGR